MIPYKDPAAKKMHLQPTIIDMERIQALLLVFGFCVDSSVCTFRRLLCRFLQPPTSNHTNHKPYKSTSLNCCADFERLDKRLKRIPCSSVQCTEPFFIGCDALKIVWTKGVWNEDALFNWTKLMGYSFYICCSLPRATPFVYQHITRAKQTTKQHKNYRKEAINFKKEKKMGRTTEAITCQIQRPQNSNIKHRPRARIYTKNSYTKGFQFVSTCIWAAVTRTAAACPIRCCSWLVRRHFSSASVWCGYERNL